MTIWPVLLIFVTHLLYQRLDLIDIDAVVDLLAQCLMVILERLVIHLPVLIVAAHQIVGIPVFGIGSDHGVPVVCGLGLTFIIEAPDDTLFISFVDAEV